MNLYSPPYTYFQKSPDFQNADGLFIAKIDGTGTLTKIGTGYYEIPTSVIRQYDNPKNWSEFDKTPGSDVQLPAFSLRQQLVDQDGNIIVVGDINGGGPMYIVSINKVADVNWWVKIPQYVRQDGFIAHNKFMVFNGNYYMFYMDTPKNIGLAIDEFPNEQSLYTDGVLVCAKITPDGRVTKSVVYEMDIHEMLFTGQGYLDISENQFINHDTRDRYSRIAKITIKD